MTEIQELERRALLHEQAALLLREDADVHESKAQRLREELQARGRNRNEHYPQNVLPLASPWLPLTPRTTDRRRI